MDNNNIQEMEVHQAVITPHENLETRDFTISNCPPPPPSPKD